MHLNRKFMLILLASFLILLGHIDCKSYFGIGYRYFGDQLLLRDEVENRHTGLFETPVIAFEYAIKEPITYIEIMSEENVKADVQFSYYDALINGTVAATASNIESEDLNRPFKICIKIYGFNDTKRPEYFTAETLRPEEYNGQLLAQPEPGEIDHLPLRMYPNELTDMNSPEDFDGTEMENDKENDDSPEEIEDDAETFESMDLLVKLGHRQKGDELIYETYQVSEPATEIKTKHKVVFYFVDNVYITSMEFVLIDYKVNKTAEEIEKGYYITYNHYTPSTMKAVIYDFNTTGLVAKMYVYGYKDAQRPDSYVSYIPKSHQYDNLFFSRFLTTESPEMQLRKELNVLQRDADGFANIPEEYFQSQHGEKPRLVITSSKRLTGNAGNILHNLTSLKMKILSLFWIGAISIFM